MKRLPLFIALATGASLLVACGQGDDLADSSANPLLRYVPADTPYVMANLEPVPANVVDAHLQRMQPFLDHMQTQLADFRVEVRSGDTEFDSDEAQAVAEAVLEEFDGKLNRAGMESLGLSLESVSAVYGNGLFPVMRLGLGDAEKFRAMIARVETKSGQSIPERTFRDTAFWRAGEDDSPMALYVAILDDHVVLSTGPKALEDEFLPGLLALETPSESLATSGALARLNRDKGFAPYGSGYVDLARVADELFEADSTTATWMASMGEFDLSDVDPACAREARLFTTFVPRLVAGTTDVTADSVSMRYQVETNALLGGQLERLVADVPAASSDPDRMVSASMSLQMGRVREFLLDSANAMAAVPFQCPQLQDLNEQVRQAAETLNQPMPPFIGNLKGFRAELSDIDATNPQPDNLRGRLSLEMESPQMVIGMASMMVPGFEELQIEPGADPVELPQELMSIATPEFEAYAVMSKDAIGVALGSGQKEGLRAFMDEDGDSDDVFFSVDYDMAVLADLQGRQSYSAGADGSGGAEMDELSMAYRDMLGRTRVELRFDGEGLTVDQTQTFR